ncbi:MAG TPA: hypothetical protein VF681_00180 [Abditibacteriaceae bacterium]|jgi:hypothetical protein
MSEREQRGQAKQFRHQRDKAFEDSIKSKHIFSERPEVFTETFRCCPINGRPCLTEGEALLILPREQHFDVVQNLNIIGRIEAGSEILSDALASDLRAGGILNASVCRLPGLSGHFEVRVVED